MGLFTSVQSCYVFSVPSGYVKVGVSDNPDRRLGEIQSYCYELVSLEFQTFISAVSPVSGYALEQLVHQKLKPFGSERREWFRVNVVDAIYQLSLAFRFLVMPIGHPKIEGLLPDLTGQLRRPAKVNMGNVEIAPLRQRGRPRTRTPEGRKAFRADLMRKKRAAQKASKS